MALGTISFEQEPIGDSTTLPVITNWNPIIPYAVKQTDISGLFYFKFILEIRMDTSGGTIIGKLKQRKNGSTSGTSNVAAIFDVKEIINSQIKDTIADQNDETKPLHLLGANVVAKPFSINKNQVKTIYVKAYQSFSSSATASPSEDTSTTVNDTKRYIQASLPLETTRGTTDFQDTAFDTYSLNGPTKKLLSDAPTYLDVLPNSSVIRNKVRTTDYHTVGFLNGQTDFNSSARMFRISYYDGANALIGSAQLIENSAAHGGSKPETSGGEVNEDSERIIYFGCGPANLEASTVTPSGGSSGDAQPSNFSNWAYYTVQAANNAGSSNLSQKYYFILDDDNCKGFKIRRLAWINSKGCWDYYNFKMKSIQTVGIKRNNYETMLGDYNSATYSYNNFDRGKRTRKTEARMKETLNTDFISESEAGFLQNLMVSTNVYVIENDYTDFTVPVMVSNSSFVKKTLANNKLKIQYSVNIEYANPINTNS